MKKQEKIVAVLAILGMMFGMVSPLLATETDPASLNSPTINTGLSGSVLVSPVASPVAGTYTSVQSVVLSAGGATSIRFTVDNSEPTCTVGTVYTGPIAVNSSLTVKAIACGGEGSFTSVKTFAYVVNLTPVPVQSSAPSGGGGGGGGSEVALSNMSIKTVGSVEDNKIDLAITATGANMMMLSNSADFSGATWEGLSTSVLDWKIKVETTKIYIKFRTPGNVVSNVFSCDVPTGKVVEKEIIADIQGEIETPDVLGEESPVFFEGDNLYGVDSNTVEIVSADEASKVLACNAGITLSTENEKVYNKIIGTYASELNDSAKQSIKCFIQNGTQTTKRLGAGERGGVLNSFAAVFSKMPSSAIDWQDIIKIANGRWPGQKNAAYEEQMKTGPFVKVYKRNPDMKKASDSSAIVIMTYGLLPVKRNMNSEKASILTFKAIYGYSPTSALDWNISRAIAYSGATR